MTNNKIILNIENLIAKVENEIILKNFNLTINTNEVHFLMGPNGCGKSTLSKLLAGHPSYSLETGKITFLNTNLETLDAEIRSKKGLFLAFQHPIEIPGINNFEFLKVAYDEKQKYFGKKAINPLEFLNKLKHNLNLLNINNEFLNRDLNVGFSGGEKKLNEILQILLLKPKLAILDEIDSGLDIDAIKRIFSLINKIRNKGISFLVITHNPKIIKYLKPNFIHIMVDGFVKKSGGADLLDVIERGGFESFKTS